MAYPFLALLANKLNSSPQPSPPTHLGGYSLNRVIRKRDNFITAVYRRHRHNYFAKIWQGKWPDLNRFNLLNEYRVLRQLNHHAQLIFRVPEVVDKIERPGLLIVFYRFINGQQLSSAPVSKQRQILTKVLDALSRLPAPAVVTNSSSRVFEILSLPLMGLVLSVLDPPLSRQVMSASFRSCLWGFRYNPNDFHFAHGDLSFENILLSPQRIWVVDWEEAKRTYRHFDLNYLAATSASTSWLSQLSDQYRSQLVPELINQIAIRQAFFSLRYPSLRHRYLSRLI